MAPVVVCVAALLAPSTPPAVTSADGYRELFDGKTLDGWVVEGTDKDKSGNPTWVVADGKIVCKGPGFGFLRYDRTQFADFSVTVEYRFFEGAGKGNSGLGIRTVPYDAKKTDQTRASFASFEIQLLDDAGKPPSDHGTASLYRYKAPTSNRVKAGPEWNTITVTAVGPKYTIAVNGETVLEADQTELKDLPPKQQPAGTPLVKDKPLSGWFALQNHGGKVEFRSVKVKELKPAASK